MRNPNACRRLPPLRTTSPRSGHGFRAWTFSSAVLILLLFLNLPGVLRAAPSILQQPQNQLAPIAGQVTFTVVVEETGNLTYQWYFQEGTLLSGATSASLVLANVQTNQAGTYRVVVADFSGSVTSAPALLQVLTPPRIVTQPTNLTVAVGSTATFHVAASGDPPFRYQWYRDVVFEIVDATNATLILTNLVPADSGTYQVVVENAVGVASSVEAALSVKVPPSIVVPPASLVVTQGQGAQFTVTVAGDPPLSYQWFFNGSPISGANGSTYAIASAQGTNEGAYSVSVANGAGSMVSDAATLVVHRPPAIWQNLVSQVVTQGGAATFSVLVDGDSPLAYEWYFNGTTLIPGVTGPSLVYNPVQPVHEGDYHVIVANALGAATSAVAHLTVKFAPTIVQQPVSLTTTQGLTATLTAAATGSAPMSLQWLRGGAEVSGATNAQLILPSVQGTQGGAYVLRASNELGVATSTPAELVVRVPPAIVVQPSDLVLITGGGGLVQVVATGDAPLFYQWWKDVTNPIAGATNAGYSFDNAQPGVAGFYSVQVSNAFGQVMSRQASVRLKSPPVIAQQPVSLIITQGQPAVFSVVPGGDPPFRYQWFFNGTNAVTDGTNASLVFFNTQASRSGSYTVRIQNEVGEAVSDPAVLTVRVPPAIVVQPIGVQVAAGNNATFTVVTLGDAPLQYQWYFNQTNALPDATNATLTIAGAQAANAGRYSVTVTNNAGTATSFSAELRLRLPPVITAQPVSLIVTQGSSASFTVGVGGDGPFTYRWFFDVTNFVATTVGPTLTLVNVQPAAVGNYSVVASNAVGTATSAGAALIVRQVPTIVRQPVGGTVAPGSSFSFDVIVTGETPLSYQWFFNGVPVAQATNSVLALSGVSAGSAGTYGVTISNLFGVTASSPAQLTVKRPPVITQASPSQVVTQDSTATFSVMVDGDGPFQFRWYRDVTNALPGNSSTLTIPGAGAGDIGDYTVVVSNDVGVAVSPAAHLTVLLKPRIVQQPASLIVTQGSTAAFSVSVISDVPATYAWRRNGSVLAGEIASTLSLANVQPISAGAFDVVVGNDYGSVTSSVANLVVRGLDFGDAPDPSFPTLLANDGARHIIVPGFSLGQSIDAEPNGQPGTGADGDDDPLHPEDTGVRLISVLRQGQSAQCEVVVTSNGVLNAWMDWNRNGTWEHPTEQIFADRAVTTGTNVLTIPVPSGGAAGTTYGRFRFSSVGGLLPAGLAANGEVEDLSAAVVAVADLRVQQSVSAARVNAGANASFTIGVTNGGPASATNVLLTAPISPRATFISAVPGAGTCSAVGGIVSCALGNLAGGAGVTVVLTLRTGSGTNETVASVTANEFDPNLANNSSAALVVGIVTPPAYANGEATVLPEIDSGPGSIYPLDIVVSGHTSRIDKVVVTLNNLTHAWPDDLDILLVGPGDRRVYLMSDCGLDNGLNEVTLSFDDDAPAFLPNTDPGITSGTYKPTNFDRSTDSFAAPAPPEPYVTNLATFKGLSPNGTWSLYVMDDSPENLGYLADGWSLTLILADPLADVSIGATGTPGTLNVGSSVQYSLAVTNRGPSQSPTSVQYPLPAGFVLVNATASRGGCTNLGGIVTCDFGNLLVDGTETATLQMTPTLGGTFTNTFTVVTAQYDGNAVDNTARVVTTVRPIADVAISRVDGPSTLLLGERMTNLVVVTNAGPNVAAAVMVTNLLSTRLLFESGTGGAGPCTLAGGVVVCDVGSIAPGTVSTLSLVTRAASVGAATNRLSTGSVELDLAIANNAWSNTVQIVPAADLMLRVTSKRSEAVLDQPFNTDYAVSNAGPSAVSVFLTNTLPSTFILLGTSSTKGFCSQLGGVVTCSLGTMNPGESVFVAVTARGSAFGNWTNVASIGLNAIDPVPANNAATNEMAIIPGADVAVAAFDAPDPVWLGENVNYLLRITNFGPVTATSIRVTNQLPSGVEFLNVISSAGSCAHNAGVITCQIPSLGPGSNMVVSINARGAVIGPATTLTTVTANEFDHDLSNNVFVQPGRVVASSGTFASSFAISIPDLGPATPYPSTIFVSGLTASVFRVRVTLTNLNHTFPDDLDILLVGPNGRSTYLLSDVGGEFGLLNAFLTFDDSATALSDSGPISFGQVRPTNFDGPETLPDPAPLGGYATNLTVFTGIDPNGFWSLYVADDASKDRGTLGGWSLNFATVDPIADLRLGQNFSATSAPLGVNFVMTTRLTNAGPATATDVRLTSTLAATFTGVTINSSQGSCALVNGTLTCDLGSIPRDGTVDVTFVGAPSATANITNVVTVSARETDLNPSDNSRTTVLDFAEPPILLTQPISQVASNGVAVTLSAQVAGSAPFTFQWYRNGNPVPDADAATLVLPSVAPIQSGTYQLRVTNRVGFVFSALATLQVIGPPTFSDFTEIVTDEDTETGSIGFLVFDFETPAEQLQLTVVSSDVSLVRNDAISFGGSGSNRTIRITPVPNAFGNLTIQLSARDGDGGVTTVPIPMTIRAVNDGPTLSTFLDQVLPEDGTLVAPFVAGDVENGSDAVQYRIISSDPRVVSPTGAVFTGTGPNRQLNLTPVLNAFGTAGVTVVVTDLEGLSVSNAFVLSVFAINDPPTLDLVPDQTVAEDSGVRSLPLTGITSGASNEVQQIQVSATTSHPDLITPPTVAYSSPLSSGTLTFAPLPDATGTATITVTVTDGAVSNHVFSRTFNVTIVPAGDPPRLSRIPDLTVNEDTPVSIPLTVTDVDSAGGLGFAATAADIALVPPSGLVFGGTGVNRSLTVTPGLDRSGSTIVRVIVTDGDGLSATNEFLLTVLSVNDRPTLAALGNVTLREDSEPTPVFLTEIGSGAANEAQALQVTASSSNPSVLPNPSVAYNSPANTGTLTLNPARDAVGTAVVTVTVDDGQPDHSSFARTFTVTVNGTNDAPVFSTIVDQTMSEDGTNAVAFTVTDAETPASLLLLSATSSNTNLIAATNITFSGSGSNRFIVLAPQPEQSGLATITVRASDGVLSNSTTFQLTVTAINDTPTLDPLNNLNVLTSPGTVSVPLTGITSGATNENQSLTVTASTTNPGFFLNQPSVNHTSPNSTGTLNLRPANNATGTATITVTVTDNGSPTASFSRSFVLTVRSSGNVLPTISLIPAQNINEDSVDWQVNFTVRDAETAAGSLTVTAFSTNPSLIPDANISLGGSLSNRTISFTPRPNQSGVASIVLTVTDGAAGSSNLTFGVTVNAVNDLPTISPISPQSTSENTPTAFIPITIGDVETPPSQLLVTASSSNLQLVSNDRVELGGSGVTRAIRMTPLPGAVGTSTITVHVSDGQLTNSTSFVLSVDVVDDPPELAAIEDVTIDEDTSAAIPVTIIDPDTLASMFVLEVESSNRSLVDNTNFFSPGTGNSRTLFVTPNADAFGTATIRLQVRDGATSLSANTSFVLTVNPMNDLPTMDGVLDQFIPADGLSRTVSLTGISGGPANESQFVALSAAVDNPALIPSVDIAYSPGESNAVLTYVSSPNAVGTARIYLTANDGQAVNNLYFRSFAVHFSQPPQIGYVPDVTTDEDVSSVPITIPISDPDGDVNALNLQAFAENGALVSPVGVSVGGAGGVRTVTITPVANQSGVSRILLVATDADGIQSTSRFFLIVRSVMDPIVIGTQPRDILAQVGNSPSFSVSATSALPLTYQWQYQGNDLPGETGTELRLANVQGNQAGSYRVLVGSSDTTVVSRTATLTIVNQPPPTHITSIRHSAGTTAVDFQTVFGGTYTLEYKATLQAATWIPIAFAGGNGDIQTLVDEAAGDQMRFYRIRSD